MIRTSIKLSALALAATLAIAPAFAQGTPTKTPTKVNGKAISQSQIDFIMSTQKAQGRPDTPELLDAVREDVIRREILVQEAKKQGLDKKTENLAKIEMARQSVLVNAYIEGYLRSHPITDEAVKKEFEAIKAQAGDKEYKARHIVVDSEDQAKEIIAKLKKGEKFETLATQSKDPGSKDKGGELGWSVPASYVKPFGEALVKLKPGQYTDVPVKSEFGWHVIQLDETRALKIPSFEEIKPQIQQRLTQQTVEKLIADLRAKAKIE